jgi:hypothetical protein
MQEENSMKTLIAALLLFIPSLGIAQVARNSIQGQLGARAYRQAVAQKLQVAGNASGAVNNYNLNRQTAAAVRATLKQQTTVRNINN